MSKFVLLLCCSSLFWYACQGEAETGADEAENVKTYLFLGHPYDWLTEDRIDPRLSLLNFSDFDGVWLGGDVCARSSKDTATLQYLDEIFDLKSKDQHWAWGNHDLMEGDAELLRHATGRPDYYTSWQEGIQFIILNTNLFWHHPWPPPAENCAKKTKQLAWLKGVLDTVNSASYLVLLHHHALFNEYKVNAVGDTLTVDNIRAIPVRPDCRINGNFTAEIYPYLSRIRASGTKVISLSGDVGMLSKGYAFQTADSIQLLGSGINNSLDMAYPPDYVRNFNPDTVLLFYHRPEKQQLDWSFVRLSEFVKDRLSEEALDSLPLRTRLLLEY